MGMKVSGYGGERRGPTWAWCSPPGGYRVLHRVWVLTLADEKDVLGSGGGG